MRSAAAVFSIGLASIAAIPAIVAAHPLAPSLLQVVELPGGGYEVTWRQPSLKLPGAPDETPLLPAHCRTTGRPVVTEDGVFTTAVWEIDCGARRFVGSSIGVEGLRQSKRDALVRVALADGRVVRRVLSGREPIFTIPERESWIDVASSYATLGVEHILTGFDHLLFVFGLFLLTTSLGQLARAVTAFTLGHSVTLSLAMLGWARAQPAVVEALIALSILVLAVEISRAKRPGQTLIGRRPWTMPALFGVLHGLGFAGALREIGLPAHDIPTALLSFNVGIEVGQIAFVCAIVLVRGLLEPRAAGLPAWAERGPAYVVGSLAAMWTIERAMVLLPLG